MFDIMFYCITKALFLMTQLPIDVVVGLMEALKAESTLFTEDLS